jgi:hypothetical protein
LIFIFIAVFTTIFFIIPHLYDEIIKPLIIADRRLNKTTMTNYIYFLILSVLILAVLFAYGQLSALKKSYTSNVLLTFNKLVYDKSIIKSKEFIINNSDKLINLDTKGLDSIKKSWEKDVSMILNLYNNLGNLILKRYLDSEDIPDIFHRNVVVYWNILKPYIHLRRNQEKDVSIDDQHQLKFRQKLYASHFERLVDESIKHMKSNKIASLEFKKDVHLLTADINKS